MRENAVAVRAPFKGALEGCGDGFAGERNPARGGIGSAGSVLEAEFAKAHCRLAVGLLIDSDLGKSCFSRRCARELDSIHRIQEWMAASGEGR